MIKFVRKADVPSLPPPKLPPIAVAIKSKITNTALLAAAGILLVLIVGMLLIKRQWLGLSLNPASAVAGIVCAALFLPIHECLHGILYGRASAVYIVPVRLGLMTFSHTPVKKRKYLAILLLPVCLLGFVPAAVWLALPPHYVVASSFLFGFSFSGIGLGIGDILAFVNVVRHVPAGGVIYSEIDRLVYSLE